MDGQRCSLRFDLKSVTGADVRSNASSSSAVGNRYRGLARRRTLVVHISALVIDCTTSRLSSSLVLPLVMFTRKW
jgi:hypothetical protein